ncbi:Vacuolar membrane protease [Frankliniella fusca]|uniref:Vacuolar membrane protease n=1 Tax=Frankliniella fusca TaxID=407009 RepID=A0AAE1H781_9NEOP|nr:Vacuolar membrane protease [Frankliniella fusca]
MAENQDYNNGFNQDITEQEYQQDDQMNGGGDAPQDSGSAEAPGKDDESRPRLDSLEVNGNFCNTEY